MERMCQHCLNRFRGGCDHFVGGRTRLLKRFNISPSVCSAFLQNIKTGLANRAMLMRYYGLMRKTYGDTYWFILCLNNRMNSGGNCKYIVLALFTYVLFGFSSD